MYIVVDIGGTNTRIAASRDLERFDAPIIIETSPRYEPGITALAEAALTAAGGEKIAAVVCGITGIVSKADGTVLKNRHANWLGKSIVPDIEARLSCKAHFENDVALVALGEAHFGAGQGSASMVYMTVSTGVNAARIVHGELDTGVFTAETGGQIFFDDGRPVTFEGLVSGTAIQKKYGKHPRELGLGHPVWEELAEIVSVGLYNSILHWSPNRVVLGGSMFNEIGISVESVRKHLDVINTKYPAMPEVVHSALGDLGGLWGGLARLRALRA